MRRRRSMWRRRSMSGRHEAAGSRAHGVRADAAPPAPIAGARRLIAQTWEARTRMMQDLSDEALMVAVEQVWVKVASKLDSRHPKSHNVISDLEQIKSREIFWNDNKFKSIRSEEALYK